MDESHVLRVQIGEEKLPFFAEYPYFVWGEVNYESDGNCQHPTDRDWAILYVHNRENDDEFDLIEIAGHMPYRIFEVTGSQLESVHLAAYLTALRTSGSILDAETGRRVPLSEFARSLARLPERLAAADRVRKMFLNPDLKPFDTMPWWGGWKWCGPFATDMTEGLRYVIMAVHEHDDNPVLVNWLRRWWAESPDPLFRDGVHHALRLLTGEDVPET